MSVATNADDYAAARQNIFFTANGETPGDGNLTGQCVTLVKWFFAEMCENFPSPFAARGDARYVGRNLVAQGLADEVPYDQRKRGDIICLEYGTYGHIYVELSNGRVFEENVNLGGVARKVVDGDYVYASRIGSDSESWRHDQHAYRLKSYKEGNDMPDDYKLNSGDNENVKKEFGFSPSEPPNLTDQPWHSVWYNWVAGKGTALLNQIKDLKAQNAALQSQIDTGLHCTQDERDYLDALKKVV